MAKKMRSIFGVNKARDSGHLDIHVCEFIENYCTWVMTSVYYCFDIDLQYSIFISITNILKVMKNRILTLIKENVNHLLILLVQYGTI